MQKSASITAPMAKACAGSVPPSMAAITTRMKTTFMPMMLTTRSRLPSGRCQTSEAGKPFHQQPGARDLHEEAILERGNTEHSEHGRIGKDQWQRRQRNEDGVDQEESVQP